VLRDEKFIFRRGVSAPAACSPPAGGHVDARSAASSHARSACELRAEPRLVFWASAPAKVSCHVHYPQMMQDKD
jgi:hypothetical protein